MRTEPRRLASAVLSIALGVAFLAIALVAGASIQATLARGATASVADASVVVSPGRDHLLMNVSTPDAIRALPGVTAVRTEVETTLQQDLGGRHAMLHGRSMPTLSDTTTLKSGRVPRARDEVLINDVAARTRNLAVGETLSLLTGGNAPIKATVVGIIGAPAGESSMPKLFAADADLMRYRGEPGYNALYVYATGDASGLLASISEAVPGATVQTGADEIAQRVKEETSGLTELTTLFAGFGLVALFVACLVVGNTFAILVAQRTRQLALVRCVGATRGQVNRSVLGESLMVGALGSTLGVALGIGGAAALAAAGTSIDLPVAVLAVTPLSLGAPWLSGLAFTLVAAVVPARRATSVAPLAALRPQSVDAGRRIGRLRLAGGALAGVAGVALLVAGALNHVVPVGMAGGLLSFVGFMIAGPSVVPAAAGALGLAARSTTGQLAVANSRRNPSRAAATTSALLVGVTLITMMSVGAETGRATSDAEIAAHYPTDALVVPLAGLTDPVRQRLTSSDQVAGWSEAISVDAVRDGGANLSLLGVSGDATAIRNRQAVAGLADGVVLVPQGVAPEGSTLRIANGENNLALLVHVTGGIAGKPVITLADAYRLVPGETTMGLVRFADSADAVSATEALADSVAAVSPGVQVTGLAVGRQQMSQMLDMVLLVAVALLGIAVVIALIGVGNTLSLSVLERTQETGLLRALGLTRAQVRGMLGIEALTLSGVAVVFGLVLGTAYGIAGMLAIFPARVPVTISIPWERLALTAAVAMLAGWAASVLPAIRASRVPPAAALAYE